jgi:hypothetical protein
MESNSRRSYYSFKYLPLLLGLMFMIIPSLSLLNSSWITFTVNDVLQEMDFWTALIVLLLGVLLVLVFLYFKDHYVRVVAMGNQTIQLQSGDDKMEINWLEVESVVLIRAAFPPLYKLYIKGHED